MSDIVVTCAKCGNNITISEFVTAETITCLKCKWQVPIPVRKPDLAATSKLKLAIAKPPEPPPTPVIPTQFNRKKARAESQNDVLKYLPQGSKRKTRTRKITIFEIKVLPWLVFIVLLLVLGWIRHVPGVLAPDTHQMFIKSGVWALVLMHVAVVLLAFGDDVFSGVLCSIIPGYSVYYLFTQADQILLRGLVAALLIVFGWDFALAAKELWHEVYYYISTWLATTESVKKR